MGAHLQQQRAVGVAVAQLSHGGLEGLPCWVQIVVNHLHRGGGRGRGPAVGELDSRQQGRWPWDPKAVKQSRVPPALTSVFRTGTQAPFSRALEMRTKGSLLLQVSLLSSLTPASASVT